MSDAIELNTNRHPFSEREMMILRLECQWCDSDRLTFQGSRRSPVCVTCLKCNRTLDIGSFEMLKIRLKAAWAAYSSPALLVEDPRE